MLWSIYIHMWKNGIIENGRMERVHLDTHRNVESAKIKNAARGKPEK